MANFNNKGPANTWRDIYGNVSSVQHINNAAPITEPICFQFADPDVHFTGRSNELLNLENATINLRKHPDDHRSSNVVVCGLGGIGKTQLVRKFIDRNRSSHYKNIIWINSDQRGLMEDEFRSLAKNRLNILTKIDGKEKDFKTLTEEVFNKLATLPTVIVFDNVDETTNTEILQLVLTTGTSGVRPHVVITSRIQEWGDSMHVLRLGGFDINDALEYVSTKLTSLEPMHKDSIEENVQLVKLLQLFPLALRQATAHINHHRVVEMFRIGDYIKQYESLKRQMLDSKHFQKDIRNLYKQTTLTTWVVTLGAINKCGATGQLALRILYIVAFFQPDHIRRDIFFNLKFPLSESVVDIKAEVTEAVRLLVNYSMVDSHTLQSVLSIHRLVQQVIKIELESSGDCDAIRTILRDGLELISEMEKREEAFKECYEHGISVLLHALPFNELIHEFDTLSATIIDKLNTYGKYIRAISFGNDILQPLTTILGEDHLVALETKFGVALVHFFAGKYFEALQMNREILEKRKTILGEDHSDTLKVRASIAATLGNMGKYSEALEMHESVFERRKIILGEDHELTLASKFSTTFYLNSLGNYKEALKRSQEVLEKRIIILGENHPHTFDNKANIGILYSNLGKYTEALQIHQEVFVKRKAILGENHPSTLSSMSRIAYTLNFLGKYAEALQMHQEVFEKRKHIIGENHPNTLGTMSRIGDSLNHLGRYSQALQIHQESFVRRKNIFGEDQAETLKSKSKIAESLSNLGNIPEALQMHAAIYETRKAILSEDHPETVDSMFNVAVLYSRLGNYSQALRMHQEVFDKRSIILGKDHPETLKSKSAIADTLYSLGQNSKAFRIHEGVLEIRKTILGEHHPDTLKTKLLINKLTEDNVARTRRTIIVISLIAFITCSLFYFRTTLYSLFIE